ncbi:MAG: dihydropteroate synthase [Flavisolibacter sp.]
MFTLNCKGRMLVLEQPIVMGIINATPDSFFSGSRVHNTGEILRKAEQMILEGAAILDIGGQSTRPGSERVSEEEELRRVLPAIEAISKNFPEQIISVDSFYARVVHQSINAGAHLVNDVSAGALDDHLIEEVASLKVPYVLMHMPGHPQNMQAHSTYQNVTLEVFDFLNEKIAWLTRAGVHDILIDVGFGFGKNAEHNFQLLGHLSYFRQLGKPLMVGLSRKATVYKTLGTGPEDALNGTTVMHTLALLNGADILRVHDVKEAVEAVKLFSIYKKTSL